MIEVTRQVALLPPQPVTVPGLPIRSVDVRLPLPAAPAPKGAGCPRVYCNDALNSRLPAAVATEGWKVRWRAPAVPDFTPAAVVQDGDRVLLYGGGSWRLYDVQGKTLKDGRNGASGLVLDAANGLFYFVNLNGFLAAHRLMDGAEEYAVNAAPGDAWPFIARRGNRFIDAAVDLPQPYRPEPPSRSILQHADLDAKIELDPVKVVSNLTALATLQMKTGTLSVALRGDDVVFAVPGSVFLSSSDLKPRAALQADFIPRSLSLDELGRIHLVVAIGDRLELWVLTPEGSRTVTRPIGREYGTPIAPPAIGYDHAIHLITADAIVAFSADGDPLWERRPQGRIAGAGISPDGHVLVTAGRDLQVYDGKGEREVIFRSLEGSLITPPAMSASGEIFVATADALYCLGR
ncbi:MAG TPA: hypothetical protein VEP66_07635 [Myxococcales bacterium]|nr:hypothetical protein [Myxococcales bacterium]